MNRQNYSTWIIVLLVAINLLTLGVSTFLAATAALASPQLDKKNLGSAAAFQDAMRKLWEDHITWTRLYIVSAAADLPDKEPTANRLLQNQVDIGNAVKPYYGDAAGEKLTALLKEHITIALDLITAAKAKDTVQMADVNRRWFANADAIATFLSAANPKNWPNTEMKHMMHDHLNLTTDEVLARVKGDWATDIATYDKIHEQILRMADMLSSGIIKQFPKKF